MREQKNAEEIKETALAYLFVAAWRKTRKHHLGFCFLLVYSFLRDYNI